MVQIKTLKRTGMDGFDSLDPDRTAGVWRILDLISDVYFGSDGSRGKESLSAAEVAGDAIPAASVA